MRAGNTLLDWLLERYPDTSRRRAKEWIVEGRVALNGTVVRKPHQMVDLDGADIELHQPAAISPDLGSGWHIHPRVTLLYLDSYLTVVNKGAGLVSVPANNCKISALSIIEDFLGGRLRVRDSRISAKSLPAGLRRLNPLPVHRLDQYTSGVFCMAMNSESREHLIEQLKVHTMKREYVAFAQGRAVPTKGTWRNWLRLSKDELTQQIVTESQGRSGGPDVLEAITHFEVIAQYQVGAHVFTQLRLKLETGRKHQIRAQAAAAGLPLIGDRTYNPDYRSEGRAPIPFDRQALHAERLELEHPETRKRVSWRAEWPADLRDLEGMLTRNPRRMTNAK
jgi:23S rRNA pseudouridine1911/1915/1917 synthase